MRASQEVSYMIGVDIGTTSTKAVLFQEDGTIIAEASQGYPLHTEGAIKAEQDPDLIVEAVIYSIQQVMTSSETTADKIQFVSFSSAMHSVIAMDHSGNRLTPALTWADNRSAAYAKQLNKDKTGHDLYTRTGTPIHPMSPLTKIMWFTREQQDLMPQIHKFISIKEYVFYQLFGVYIVDHSIASATGLLRMDTLDWDEEALRVAGISADHLSELVPTTHVIQDLHPSYAEQMQLAPSTPFVVGASDGVLSNLGVGAIDPGVVAITIGTSGAIRTVVDRPIADPKGRYFCYALTEQKWVIGGPVNNGGVIFRWIRDELASSEVETAKRLGVNPYEVLADIAEKVPAGSDGLLFHPYMMGERAPLWNPDARGSFFGLTLQHKKEHMVRAALEGVLFNLYTVMLAIEEQIGRPKTIHATGGFARTELWRQMMANIFDQKVIFPDSIESSCLGAVILGMYATGKIDSLDVTKDMIGSTYHHDPEAEAVSVYRELLPIFIRISRKFEEEYAAITAFQIKMDERLPKNI
ncbi:gluconokinase [Paenibacillus gallinarum]|uniref:Gluconokinase n=1 Tax=Paenibacillus gallinarum TaxID=2762232 RepID=A0ABR8T027_9BACL|nr:gluconokinase [Paenibacillus gallinarum]MBD7969108.1 gluconokinase [Paenibacillus gallinarum]